MKFWIALAAFVLAAFVVYYAGYVSGSNEKHLEWCKAFGVDRQSDAEAVATFSSNEENDKLTRKMAELISENESLRRVRRQ